MKNNSTTTSKRPFLFYVVGILILTLLAQIPLILSIENTLLSLLGLVLVAVFMGYFFQREKKLIAAMSHRTLLPHAVAYLIVIIIYQAHALIVLLNPTNQADVVEDLFANWYGLVLVMPVIWGVGLLIHLVSELFTSRALIKD